MAGPRGGLLDPRFLLRFLSFALGLMLQGYAAISSAQTPRADDYPSKPIRMIVPFAPGGPPDVIGRPLMQKLSGALGQPILFDNRPGAAGMIGSEVVAKSPRDGYTMLYTTGSLAPVGSTPEEFAAFIEKDLAFFRKALGDAKIEPQ